MSYDMRISDWSSDVCSSDLKRQGVEDAGEPPHYHGHRERLRERLLQRGGASLADYEVLEFLLFGARTRGDMKPLAKALLARFGSIGRVLTADPAALDRKSTRLNSSH